MHYQDNRVKSNKEVLFFINFFIFIGKEDRKYTDERDEWVIPMTRKKTDSRLHAAKLCCDTLMDERLKPCQSKLLQNVDGAHHEKQIDYTIMTGQCSRWLQDRTNGPLSLFHK